MYNIEYSKDNNENTGTLKNVKSITIDTKDIMMMKYEDLFYKGDKNLIILYLKYLKDCYLNHTFLDKYVIENNSELNKSIILSIILSNWLINENSFDINLEILQSRKEIFESKLSLLKNSKKIHDKHCCILMQYYIESFNYILQEKNEKKKVK